MTGFQTPAAQCSCSHPLPSNASQPCTACPASPACLCPPQGQYAFAVFDGEKRQVFAARDSSGSEPLYYELGEDVGVSLSNAQPSVPYEDGEGRVQVGAQRARLPSCWVWGHRQQVLSVLGTDSAGGRLLAAGYCWGATLSFPAADCALPHPLLCLPNPHPTCSGASCLRGTSSRGAPPRCSSLR